MSDFVFLKPGIKPGQTGTAVCVTCENIFGVSYSVIKYVFYIENPVSDDELWFQGLFHLVERDPNVRPDAGLCHVTMTHISVRSWLYSCVS